MRSIETIREHISFAGISGLPEVDALFTACRVSPDRNFVDIIDFRRREIDRWSFRNVKVPRAVDILRQNVPVDRLPAGLTCYETYCKDHLMRPHAAHLSHDGKLFVSLSDNYNGFCVCVIDTRAGQGYIFPDDFDDTLMCYTSTGGFTHDNHWMFLRWPLMDTVDIANGKKDEAGCEIGQVNIQDMASEVIHTVGSNDGVHQIACSPSGRHAVFSSFKCDLRVPYPAVSIQEDPAGYRRSHTAGMKTTSLTTVDLDTKRHWVTHIPVPAPAHCEFDPFDPDSFYLSAHHISPAIDGVMIEGPAAVFKMRIGEGETVIEGSYTDDRFFRIRQHVPFRYQGRTIIAVTNFPNHLDLIDAGNMLLLRRIELFPAPPLDFSPTGNALCPVHPESCFFINPSRDGKYIVLGNSRCFSIYDIDRDCLRDVRVPLYLPEGCVAVGHTRSVGE